MNSFLLAGFLLSCLHRDSEVVRGFPAETVNCDKAAQLEEAELNVHVEGAHAWNKVGFVIAQGENVWDTNLAPAGPGVWEIQMRLIELECVEDFEYEIYYFHEE